MYRSKPQYPPHDAKNREVTLYCVPDGGGVPWSSDAWGWPDDLFSYRIFDWRTGDHTTPLVGPSLTATGSTSSYITPFSNRSGSIAGQYFDGSDQYTPATAFITDPGPTEDVIWTAMYCIQDWGQQNIISAWVGDGIGLMHTSSGQMIWRIKTTTTSERLITVTNADNAFVFTSMVIDRGASQVRGYLGGVALTPKTLLSGVFPGRSLYIGGPAGYRLYGTIARVQIFRGVGIGTKYSDDYAKYYASSILGLCPTRPKTYCYLTRSGVVLGSNGSNLFPLASNIPNTDQSKGVTLHSSLTNRVFKNAGVVSGDESTFTLDPVDGSFTKTTVSATLETYNIYGNFNRVYSVTNNMVGTTGYIYQGVVPTDDLVLNCGNTNKRSVSVRARYITGSGCEVGLYDPTTATWTKAADISDNYVRSHGLVTPSNTSQRFAIKVPTGASLRFVWQVNCETNIESPEIMNLSATVAAATGDTSINWGVNLSNTMALVEAEVAPSGWSATADGSVRSVLTDTTSSGKHLQLDSTNQKVIINDGTNNAEVAITETDGVFQTIRTSYGSHGLVAEVAGVQNRNANYDGSIGNGEAKTEALNRRLRRLIVLKRER